MSAAISSPQRCMNSTFQPGLHWPADKESIGSLPTASAEHCMNECCSNPACTHWVFTTSEPPPGTHICPNATPCCYLKSGHFLHSTAVNNNDTIGVLARSAHGSATITVTLPAEPLRKLDPRFVSVGCETWEWLFDPTALDNPILRRVARAFAPAVLRVGGISAMQTHFTSGSIPAGSPWPPVWNGTHQVNLLNSSTFDKLVSFCRDTGLSLMFDLNEMWGRLEDPHAPFNMSGIEAFLKHVKHSGALAPRGPLFAIEVGNELTGHAGRISVATQARDYTSVTDLLQRLFPRPGPPSPPMLYGPSASSLLNMTQFLDNATGLDAFTFHIYPSCDIFAMGSDPSSLRRIEHSISGWLAQRQASETGRGLPFALTETNSCASTFRNGGQNCFVNGFWYITMLGSYARAGAQFAARWKLWDPRVAYRPGALMQTFGFLDKNLRHATPDLWVALLHKQLIGDGAPLDVHSDNDDVLAWAHCQHGNHSNDGQGSGGVVLMLANARNISSNVTLNLSRSGRGGACIVNRRAEYILTAANNDLGSPAALLNGAGPALHLGADGSPPPFASMGRVVNGTRSTVLMPPHSYGFVQYWCAGPGFCNGS